MTEPPKKMAMLAWWPSDYLAATRGFTLAERGAYTDLLWYSWEMGGLPAEVPRLARMLGIGEEEFKRVWPALQSKFIRNSQNLLVNPRLERERLNSQERRAKALEKATKAAIASWKSPKRPARSKAQSKACGTATSINATDLHGAKQEHCPQAPAPAPYPARTPSQAGVSESEPGPFGPNGRGK